jgi:hypothetical protein
MEGKFYVRGGIPTKLNSNKLTWKKAVLNIKIHNKQGPFLSAGKWQFLRETMLFLYTWKINYLHIGILHICSNLLSATVLNILHAVVLALFSTNWIYYVTIEMWYPFHHEHDV